MESTSVQINNLAATFVRLFKNILDLNRRMRAEGQTIKHYKSNNKQPNLARGEKEGSSGW